MSDKKVPKVRFSGFTDAWEQRRLGDIIIFGIKGKAKAQMSGTESVYLETSYLNGGKATYIDSPTDVEKDDILILWDGSQAGTVYHGFSGALGSTLKAYRAKESGAFLYQQLKRSQKIIYDRYRTPNIPHVVKTFANEFMVSVPSVEEQQKIGAFFKQLDHTIALHQRKLDKLQELKKAFLDLIFSQKLRFEGFEGEWRQRKFKEIVKRVTQQSDSKMLPKVEFGDIFSGQGLLNKDVSKKLDYRKGTVFEPGCILYGKLRPYLGNWLLANFSGIALGDFWVFKPQSSLSSFVYYLIQSDKYQSVANISKGTKMPRSDWNIVSQAIFNVPIIDEQSIIGIFFKQVDHLIIHQQKKIETIRKLKQSFLNNMLI